MASSTTIASVIQSLQASTGAIKSKATQIVTQGKGIQGSEATFQLTGDSLANLQDQINNTRQNTLSLAQIINGGGIPTRVIGSDTQVIFNEKLALTGSPNLTFDYTDGILNVFSVDETYQVGLGKPASGIGFLLKHIGPGDTVSIAGKTITSLKGGVAGKTIWFLADNGSDEGTLGISDGSGSGGFDGNGAQIYGQASNGLLQALSMETLNTGIDTKLGYLGGGLFGFTTTLVSNSEYTGIGPGIAVCQRLISGSLFGNIWELENAGGYGTLALADGTGSGGFDGNGAQIYGNGSTGLLQAVQLQLNVPLGLAYGGFPVGNLTNFTAFITSPGGGTSWTTTAQNSRWEQAGKMVFIAIDITGTVTGSTSGLVLSGLPVTPHATSVSFANANALVITWYDSGSVTFFISNQGGFFPTGAGANRFVITGWYEAA